MSAVSFPTQCLEVDQQIAICTADLPTCLSLRRVNKYCRDLYDTNLLTKLFLRLAPHLASETADGRIEIRPRFFTTLRAVHPGNRWLEMACYAIPRGAFGRLDAAEGSVASTVIPALFREGFAPMRTQKIHQDMRRGEVRLRQLNGDNIDGLLDQAKRLQQEKDKPSREAECNTLHERRRLINNGDDLLELLSSEVSQWTNWDWLPDSLQEMRRTQTEKEFCVTVSQVLVILNGVEVYQSMDTDRNADDVRTGAKKQMRAMQDNLQSLGVVPGQRTASWPCLSDSLREAIATTMSSVLIETALIGRRLELLDYEELAKEKNTLVEKHDHHLSRLDSLRECADASDSQLRSWDMSQAWNAGLCPDLQEYVKVLRLELEAALAEVYLPHLTRCHDVLQEQATLPLPERDNQQIRDAINRCPYALSTRIWKNLYDCAADGVQEWQWAENHCYEYVEKLDDCVMQMRTQYQSAKWELAARGHA